MKADFFDIVIIGGGIMGCSTAYYLTKGDNKLKVAVIEKDPTYSFASSTLSMANIRIQFSLKENIQISKYTLEILKNFGQEMAVDGEEPDVGYKPEGNLFLVNKQDLDSAKKTMVLQKNLNCEVDWLAKEKIIQTFPLYNPAKFAGGTYSSTDGYIDAYSFLMSYKAKARSGGIVFLDNEVTELMTERGSIRGVKLASGEKIHTETAVNCAGAWAGQVAVTAGVRLPLEPVKRQVFVLDTKIKPDGPLPLTNLPGGLYFRSETGGNILIGKSMQNDPVGFDFTTDHQRFTDILWPELVNFVPSFDQLKLIRSWAGLYAVNTFDGNALLGEYPDLKGLFLVNGFSGHGLQQAPAAGRYISQLLLSEKPSPDLSVFSPRRLLENKSLSENCLV